MAYTAFHDNSNAVAKKGIEYKLIKLYLNNPDMDIVAESDLFPVYVQEIYDFLYGDEEVDAQTRDIRLGRCRERARKNIRKKADAGLVQVMVLVPVSQYISIGEKVGEKKVSSFIVQHAKKAIAL